jgi:hypothetical protein
MAGGARRAHIDAGRAVGHHWAGCVGVEQISVGHMERTSGRVGAVGETRGAGHAGRAARGSLVGWNFGCRNGFIGDEYKEIKLFCLYVLLSSILNMEHS